MSYSSTVLGRAAAIAVVASSLLWLTACQNTAGSVWPTTKSAGPSLTSEGYKWIYPVDAGTDNPTLNEVTGINDNDDIVGNYTSNLTGTGSCAAGGNPNNCSDCPLPSGSGVAGGTGWSSYTSQYSTSGYTSFTPTMFPKAVSQYLYAIGNRSFGTVEYGCVVTAGGDLHGTWGLVDDRGLWSIISKASGKSNKTCTNGKIGELLGVESTKNLASGYYASAADATSLGDCPLKPWTDSPGDTHSPTTVAFPGSFSPFNVEANGITLRNTNGVAIVGAAATATRTTTGPLRGWYAPFGSTTSGGGSYTAKVFSYPGTATTNTAFTGVRMITRAQAEIVGWYVNGTNTHGFVFTYGPSSAQSWKEIDALSTTYMVIRSINNNGDICGWYLGSDDRYHGFVGLATGTLRRRHHQGHVAPRLGFVPQYRPHP